MDQFFMIQMGVSFGEQKGVIFAERPSSWLPAHGFRGANINYSSAH
jgi:hypothetical protein